MDFAARQLWQTIPTSSTERPPTLSLYSLQALDSRPRHISLSLPRSSLPPLHPGVGISVGAADLHASDGNRMVGHKHLLAAFEICDFIENRNLSIDRRDYLLHLAEVAKLKGLKQEHGENFRDQKSRAPPKGYGRGSLNLRRLRSVLGFRRLYARNCHGLQAVSFCDSIKSWAGLLLTHVLASKAQLKPRACLPCLAYAAPRRARPGLALPRLACLPEFAVCAAMLTLCFGTHSCLMANNPNPSPVLDFESGLPSPIPTCSPMRSTRLATSVAVNWSWS
jgi:hypothetical protein